MAGALVVPGVASASSITGVSWDTSNTIDLGLNSEGTGSTKIYDRDVTGGVGDAVTNGQLVYTPPEAIASGLQVINDGYTGTKTQDFDGCIMTSNPGDGVTNPCDGEFQSGKRIKQQITDIGPIDLVFGVERDDATSDNGVSVEDADDGSLLYQVYHRLINVTGGMLDGFTVELGTGVGDGEGGFVRSGDDDGLSFSQDVRFGPDNLAAFSQFPFGLFGSLTQPNPNPLNLPGFFDTTARAGFNVSLGEDVIESTGMYGAYDDLFGSWLSQDMVPNGLLYDYEDGKDPLVMAWAREDGWEFLRCTETADNGCIGSDPQVPDLGVGPLASEFFAYDFGNNEDGISEAMFDYIAENLVDINGNPLGFEEGADVFKPFLLVDAIEDLANLNLSFAILLGAEFEGDSFTLRVTANEVNPIPLPAAAPLLIAGLGALGFAARRRRKAA